MPSQEKKAGGKKTKGGKQGKQQPPAQVATPQSPPTQAPAPAP